MHDPSVTIINNNNNKIIIITINNNNDNNNNKRHKHGIFLRIEMSTQNLSRKTGIYTLTLRQEQIKNGTKDQDGCGRPPVSLFRGKCWL